MGIFKQLMKYFWDVKGLWFMSIGFLALATAAGLVYPNLLRILIDDVFLGSNYDIVPTLSLILVSVIALKASLQFFHGFCGGRVGNHIAYNLRNAAYKKLQYLSFQYYDRAKTGDLMSRLTADLEGVRNFFGFGFAQILNVILMVVFGAAMMFFINWQLTLVVMAIMPIMAFTAIRFEHKIHPAFRSIRRSFADLTTAVQENITGVRTVKSFAREDHELDKFSVRSEEYKKSHVNTADIWGRFFPVMELIANFALVLLISVGGYFVISDQNPMTLGDLGAFSALIWYIIGPMWNLGFLINGYTQSKASGERILEILHQPIHVKDKPGAIELNNDEVKGHVKFEKVNFSYPDNKKALENINIDAPAGSVIGILGGTGSGKTSIIQLLIRAYESREGKITLDGHNIKDLKLESLRKQIAIVFQETFLFSASIRDNLAYGRMDVSEEELIRAAKLADAHEFIMEQSEGYNTVIGERGMGLSGGQKQRIAIARAIIKDPKILILDDATSAVDMETEHEIQQGLKDVMKGRTTFIIAHRISSLKHADEIIVLEEGRVVQRGTHESLLRQPGPYLDTFNIQYSDRPDLDTEQELESVSVDSCQRRQAN